VTPENLAVSGGEIRATAGTLPKTLPATEFLMGPRMAHRNRNSRRGRYLDHCPKARGHGTKLRAVVGPNSLLHHQEGSSAPSPRQEPGLRATASLQGWSVFVRQVRTNVWPECQTVVVDQDVNHEREVLTHPVKSDGDSSIMQIRWNTHRRHRWPHKNQAEKDQEKPQRVQQKAAT
jgi:hypothetical protein